MINVSDKPFKDQHALILDWEGIIFFNRRNFRNIIALNVIPFSQRNMKLFMLLFEG